MGESQYNVICLTEIKRSINNIKTKVWNVGPHLITTFGIQRQRNSETEASLVYRTIFKNVRATWTKTYKQEDSNSRLINYLITE